eukprot:TRINITY_DN5258_c0_g1_i1.p1 TRINITY_DN5258_c0_g1~~TRINITY_DN5258_c0_g1_i1.p1  ORF type:complete len:161 (-),score=29.08 TRINITY_DN5258_c0_g1_i1:262-744(-)
MSLVPFSNSVNDYSLFTSSYSPAFSYPWAGGASGSGYYPSTLTAGSPFTAPYTGYSGYTGYAPSLYADPLAYAGPTYAPSFYNPYSYFSPTPSPATTYFPPVQVAPFRKSFTVVARSKNPYAAAKANTILSGIKGDDPNALLQRGAEILERSGLRNPLHA